MFFKIFFSIVIIQRLVELMIAKKNEKWMKSKGGEEYGQKHYLFLVMIHTGFFLFLLLEVTFYEKSLSKSWLIWFSFFLITQIGRVWVISSLGRYWNTKIIVLPNANIVSKGPYKYLKHPNYLIVTIELIIIPIMFNAYITLICFFILNQIILSIRIPFEEQVLLNKTNYHLLNNHIHRFIPKIKK
ncbi:isoprenylcysteine carboxyl methyltransferase family protein [Heyndrickxia sp. NPDC080065]|uniref:isoprenylcysteine carboxyl methyltransferase family protein n=1 Tax=Heyndrickxia sp. NPDC080065 TaxID=3390568 RepID=UPI003D03B055